ncbi:MAG: IS607 family transposase [Candidatus Hodarchaeota archaeon]
MPDIYLTIGEVAKRLGKSTATIRRWEKEGFIKGTRTPKGHRMFPESEVYRLLGIEVRDQQASQPFRVALYARVSTRKQKDAGNLDRQGERLQQYARTRGYQIVMDIRDLGSGINENRRGLKRLITAIQQEELDRVLIEYKDRLARFGYTYLEEMAQDHGVTLEIIEDRPQKELQDELLEDLIAIVTSFAARLYGRRSKHFQALKQCVIRTTDAEKATSLKRKRTKKK